MAAAQLRVSEAAVLAGVSDDTIRRWAESGRLVLARSGAGPQTIDAAQLASILQQDAPRPSGAEAAKASPRNRFTGIVTRVTRDTVMAQVELQAGPFRIVSLISREAADELGLEAGSVATATVKATSVSVTLP